MRTSHVGLIIVISGLIGGCGGGTISKPDSGVDANRDSVDVPRDQSSTGDGSDAAPGDAQADRGSTALGQPCTSAAQCQSGFCADGVCCATACAETCMTCAAAGSPGTCTAVAANTVDPRNTCVDQGIASCGTNGKCDGAGACAYYSAGLICRASRCIGSTKTNASICDGAGTCQNGTSSSCGAFTCDTISNECRTSCTAGTQANDCTPGNYCVNSSCGLKPPGAGCGAGTECASGFCQQGVCCTSACAGTCMSCAVAGSTGSCTAVPDGMDPLGQCNDQGKASCGNDGFCDGTGKCRLYVASTECKAPSCSIDGKALAGRCDGDGKCLDGAFVSCSPYLCASATDCASSCTTDAQCAAPFSCQGGKCGKKTNGATCASPAECTSGFCESGTCCGTACLAPCKSCSTGTCTNFSANTDPSSECAAEAATTCGLTGYCDGNGACAHYGTGTLCKQATCSGSTLTPASRCDGQGGCLDKSATTCTPYMCSSTDPVCMTACTDSTQCLSPNTCNTTTGSCGKKPTGAACSAASECDSGVCAQGFCCSTTCTGTCMSCGVSGAEGTCSPIPAGTAAPAGQCSDNGAASCGSNGKCDGKGTCQLYSSGTSCGSATCNGSTESAAPQCDGLGTCKAGATRTCDPYVCGTSACRTSCTGVADCGANYSCVSNRCQLLPTGTACSAGAQCATGICAQGYCCSTVCSGCNSCGLTGTLGTCKPLANGATPSPASTCTATDPSGCKTDGLCDGNGGCRNYPAGTTCGAASCVGSALTPAKVCDGNGSCASGGSVKPCDPYMCNADGTACRSSCSSNTDCVSTATCDGTTCGLLPLGASCGSNAACNSGFCVDGVCCNNACTGTCMACNLTGNGGSCTPVGAGNDPANECTPSDASTCGLDGTCDGSGACRYHADGTSCAVATCSDTRTLVSARSCDGTAHTCRAGTTTSCAPYACASAACKTSCTVDTDCATGYKCNGTTCMASDIIPGAGASFIGTGNYTSATTVTFTHHLDWDAASGGARKGLIVLAATARWQTAPTTITYEGQGMKLLTSQTSASGTTYVFYIVEENLPATLGNKTVSMSIPTQTYGLLVAVQSFASAGQSTPVFAKAATNTTSIAAPPTGTVLADFLAFEQGSATVGAGQTQIVNPSTNTNSGFRLGASYKACGTANPCTMSWATSATNGSGIVAVAVSP